MAEPIDAIEVGCLAARALARAAPGRIAAAFERSFYLATDAQWICVGPAALGAGPLNLRCRWPDGRDFPAGGPRVGDPAQIGDGRIRVGTRYAIRFAGAPVWSPRPPGPWTGESLRRGLRALDRIVDRHAPDQGLAPLIGGAACGARLPAVAAAGFGPLAALGRVVRADLAADSPSRAPDLARLLPLIGLGPGLTPSGDDALGGALIALAALGRAGPRDAIWEAIEPAARAATNDVSLAHLRAAAAGYGAAALHDMVADLMTGATGTLAARLDALGAIGHTSGWDALAGAAAVLRAFAGARAELERA